MNMKLYGIRHIPSGRLMAIDEYLIDDEGGSEQRLAPSDFHENDFESIFLNSTKKYVQSVIDNMGKRGGIWNSDLPSYDCKPDELEVVEVKLTFKK